MENQRQRLPSPYGSLFYLGRLLGANEEKPMSYVKALKCRECGQEYKKTAKYVCEFCFGPLEAAYDYDKIKEDISREKIATTDLFLMAAFCAMLIAHAVLPIDGRAAMMINSPFCRPLVILSNSV